MEEQRKDWWGENTQSEEQRTREASDLNMAEQTQESCCTEQTDDLQGSFLQQQDTCESEQANDWQGGIPTLGEMGNKKGSRIPTGAKVVVWAVVFGLVASFVFAASTVVLSNLTGKLSGSAQATETSQEENETQLVKTASAVTSDVSEIVEQVMPCVASITNMSVQEVQSFFGTTQQVSESAGSGIILGKNDTELLVVTNNHVVESSQSLTVTFVDGSSVEAKIKGTDSDKDLAVVAVSLSELSEETMEQIAIGTTGDSTALKVGEPAIAIGNALGYGQSVTTGVISATNRQLDGFDCELIQTDAAISPGNSGGALINAAGEIIGINSAKAADSYAEGMGFAIPISDVSEIIEDLMNQETKEKVAEEERGYLGIQGEDVDSTTAQRYNIPQGVYVSYVEEGFGAAKAGLSAGMIITEIDGTSVTSLDALKGQLEYYKAGQEVTLTVYVQKENGYEEKSLKVTLSASS